MTSPGRLFATLWPVVSPHANAIVVRPWDGCFSREFAAISGMLVGSSTEDVPEEIESYLAGGPVPFECSVTAYEERAFVVMRALDAVAVHIHPAFPSRLPGVARAPSGMLARMKATRTSDGHYADVPGIGIVVPKGHLVTRAARPVDVEEASGTDLAHQFAHLTLVEHLGQGRSIRFVAPAPSKFIVSTGRRADVVGLAPIAEDRDDIEFSTCERGARPFLDTAPKEPLLSGRITVAVTTLLDGGAGVIVLPELVASPGSAAALLTALRGRGSVAEGLILAGSGASATLDAATGRPHNEAVLVGANGRILARQRKMHLFNMASARMGECGIGRALGHDGRNHMEDAAAGTELVVCDLHGLGRVMTLICEDLQQQVPGGDLALVLRPDWILTPVLDVKQAEGRWTHLRAIEIGRKTLSRVVVSCCATLAVRSAGQHTLASTGGVSTGICFDGANRNRVKFVQSTGALTPDRSMVSWESDSWPTHRIVLP